MLNMKEHVDALWDLVQVVTVADNLPVSDRKKLNLFSMVLHIGELLPLKNTKSFS